MFEDFALGLNLLLFAVAAGLIWWAGIRLERLTDAIARLAGIGGAFAGLVLLAAATSLPEVATTVTAVLGGNVELAVHNLLGSVAFNVVVLAIADAAVGGRGPLTRFAPSFGLLTEGVGVIFLLCMAIGGFILAGNAQFPVSLGEVTVGFNPVMLALAFVYVAVIRLTWRAEGSPRWRPIDEVLEQEAPDVLEGEAPDNEAVHDRSKVSLGWAFAGVALLVLAAGWVAATLADVMAEQSGISSGFVGATLLAAATSLPEVSTTVAAARRRREVVAVSNVFGSNCFNVALLALASLLAGDAFPAGDFSSAVFMTALGAMLTCVYLWGLLERSDRAVGRLGVDSIVVVALYVAGLGALYGMS